ncbi:tRNA (N6-threonylcarbamoyladenosine(37)-N6)-methyltransferase TrmO [Bradyrhizobium sp. U87765 SZCCT0131]|uniref:tRNA (N6-threonylcarbamoyladenosine(37)-N6)-methyltransferase TrmO n=1 Tax=unclassified Bradyrhizobium TaxID=2631580 RepID=UPI001BABD2D6|nr:MULTISPECIES: tRNA (N6-threonylcarbamoyladenosine(37)-N6)-methyltransferase TrmO [unclassified Bradyrhizobium]MBR1219911.1 tRNA (N6-threonylcarbamoyladenosine(37)-N6)-methyltransferase TrmO [Bradyrhizobium sp. U87765 SZCCT0131]MBR1263633.1 tRNA (N6-threonylcarbamoyladenosine(37)-N6)-methyltransferase TrmO [Bradyrhizobium sp. U87765 SZCCT0134]MBR1309202.1 tRNA (N6-threonylcarbamoyladenosine(37)-N6)-methyltransferase TrmO [Bradyrhizobium sp. U87765 SZCCT0110]MBR1323965.1 tRNA (N6-threonylcarba
MVRENEIREGEVVVELPPPTDAGLIFIGRIRTPWTSRLQTPRQGRQDGPACRIEIFDPWGPALTGLDLYEQVEVIYWLHQSRRDLVLQSPASDGATRGTFSLRSPVRPNPLGTSIAKLVGIEGSTVLVRGLDCLDGTPLVDLKPDRCAFTPIAPPQPGDFEVGDH